MWHLVLVSSLMCAPATYGDAPKETLDPAATMGRLLDTFKNCEFSAVQTFRAAPPPGGVRTATTDIQGWLCADAIVIQTRHRTANSMDRTGQPIPDSARYEERRWTRDAPELCITIRERWPMAGSAPEDVHVNSIVAYPRADGDQNIVFGGLILREFFDVNQPTAVTLRDMVTEGGRRGYRFQNATWASPDQKSSVTYHFASSDYGLAAVTFSRENSGWMPTKIVISKSGENKLNSLGRPGHDRVNNGLPYADFTQPTQGLDRLELVYDIAYNPNPVSIRREETRYLKNEQSVVSTSLNFNQLISGKVSVADVQRSMLPVANGTEVIYGDPELKKLAWMTQDGQIVKKVDQAGLDAGRHARFSAFSSLKYRIFVISNAIVVAVLLAYVVHRRRTKVR
jgi:hypothetical protein